MKENTHVQTIWNQTVNLEEEEKMNWEDALMHTQKSAFTSKQIAAKKVAGVISFMQKAKAALMLPMRQDIFRKMVITIVENPIMQWIDVRIGRTLQMMWLF